jgi:hypothetical protein
MLKKRSFIKQGIYATKLLKLFKKAKKRESKSICDATRFNKKLFS